MLAAIATKYHLVINVQCLGGILYLSNNEVLVDLSIAQIKRIISFSFLSGVSFGSILTAAGITFLSKNCGNAANSRLDQQDDNKRSLNPSIIEESVPTFSESPEEKQSKKIDLGPNSSRILRKKETDSRSRE